MKKKERILITNEDEEFAFFKGIFENTIDGILVADERKNFIMCNKTICEMLGYEEKELLTKNLNNIHPADSLQYVAEQFEKQIKEKLKVATDLPVLRKDGSIFFADIGSYPIKIDKKTYLVGYFRDVTGRKKITEELISSEEKFRNIIQSSPMGIHIYKLEDDNKLIFDGYNTAANKILGIDCKIFMGKTIEDAFPPLKETEVPMRYRKAARDKEPWFTEQINYDDKKITGAYEVHAFQTQPGSMAVLFLDITERKRLEHNLQLTQFSVDHSADPTYWIDIEGNLAFVNKSAAKTLGYTESKLLSMSIFDVDPNISKNEWKEYWKILKKDGSIRIESNNKKKNGKSFPVDMLLNLISYESHEFCCAFIRDITQQKEAEKILMNSHDYLEQKVKERTRELEKSNEELKGITAQLVQSGKLAALGELTAGVAHELNQPLNGIKITSQSLQLDMKRERFEIGKLNEKLNNIVHQVDKMSEIIQHMRIFTRKTYDSSLKQVNIFEIIKGAFTFVEQQFINNNITIILDENKDPVFITVDSIAIEQVLLNILSNARHALNKCNKNKKELIVKVKEEKDTIMLSIQDNGDGIHKNEIDKIFDPFFTTKEPGEGTGLGLSVSYKIIEENNGTITVDSKPGEYTKFNLSFPKK